MRYNVYNTDCELIASFNSEEERYRYLKSIATWSGIDWLVYDLSRFPHRMTSRVLYLDEE